MPTINVENLLINLQKKISRTPTDSDLLNLAATLKQLKSAVVLSLNSVSELPSATSSIGKIYYVDSEQELYYPAIINTETNETIWKKFSIDYASRLYVWGEATGFKNGVDNLFQCCPREYPTRTNFGASYNSLCDVGMGIGHMNVLDFSGSLYNWGTNSSGQLGIGNCCTCSTPNLLPGSWIKIQASDCANIGIKTDGTMWVWGYGYYGKMGTGVSGNDWRLTPFQILGGGQWCDMAYGYYHGVGIKCDGTIWSWGYNSNGQLGNGTTIRTQSPQAICGGINTWCDVSAGSSNSYGLTTAGIAYGWGAGTWIGDGTGISRCSPVTIAGTQGTWCKLAKNDGFQSHMAGIKNDGTLWTWGNNNCGQLGNGSAGANQCSPVLTAIGGTNWCHVRVQQHGTSGVKTDGTLWTWGTNDRGQLGIGFCCCSCSVSTFPIRPCGCRSNYWKSFGDPYNTSAFDIFNVQSI